MIEETRNTAIPEENDTGLLDTLVVIAENYKLLIFGPLFAGLLAFGVCHLVPQSYSSESIIALPAVVDTNGTVNVAATTTATTQAAAMMTSPLVLDPLIASLKLSGDGSVQAARKKLANQIKAMVGKDGLLRLDVTAGAPSEAQNIANTLISAWLKSTVPGAEERAGLEKRLESSKSSLLAVEGLLKRLTSEGSSSLFQPLTRGEAGTSIVAISELQTKFLSDVLGIPRLLNGYSPDVVKQPPTLPTEPISPKKSLISVLVYLVSGFVLLLWIFARQAWRRAATNSDVAKQQRRFLSVFGLN